MITCKLNDLKHMKHIPILFSTPMVQAILEGRKTKTRRTKGLEFINESFGEWEYLGLDPLGHLMRNEYGATNAIICPYGKVGDVLWVRETITILEPEHCMGGMDSRFVYKADMCDDSEEVRQDYIKHGYPYKWKPSIHMPKSACRLFLKVTDVAVERLHDISEEDAKAEGAAKAYQTYPEKARYKLGFSNLWSKINGQKSWDENPFVWVITFERAERPPGFVLTARYCRSAGHRITSAPANYC